ncbi:MAG: TetR family transcriptional regulator [Acidimicrobiales bacterium]
MAGDREPLQRDAIVEAARQLVIAGGLEALSLRRLAAQLGVTAPALYAHVRHKQDLLRAIAEVEFDRLVARFDAVAATDPVARIRAHGRAYVEHAREHPELFRVMFLFPPEMIPADVPDDVRLAGSRGPSPPRPTPWRRRWRPVRSRPTTRSCSR